MFLICRLHSWLVNVSCDACFVAYISYGGTTKVGGGKHSAQPEDLVTRGEDFSTYKNRKDKFCYRNIWSVAKLIGENCFVKLVLILENWFDFLIIKFVQIAQKKMIKT